MIGSIKGSIILVSDKFIIVDVSGVGYKTWITNNQISSLKEGDDIFLWVYTAVRENSIDLYGFISIDEMSLFELLLDVSGVGPKSALSIVGLAEIKVLKTAIAKGDVGYLNKVSGIGRKTAEKIIIELRDKLHLYDTEDESGRFISEDNDTMEALKSLGYSLNEAREVVKNIPKEIEGTNARVKEALRLLNIRN